jgi:membrane associated rhomboid family serine protease
MPMGIYDREYYRREGPSFLGSIRTGEACKWLIIANIAVFVLQIVTNQSSIVTDALVLTANDVMHGQVWRLLTYAFLHDPHSWQHILFNMLFLWWFGTDVEAVYGKKEFLSFYLVSAVVGGILFVLAAEAGLIPTPDPRIDPAQIPCLGASGAVTAVLVLCALHFPSRVILIMFILPMPIWAFVVFQVAQDAFAFFGQSHTGTAVTVHLGGALFAFCYYKGHWRLSTLWGRVREWQRRLSRPRLRVYREQQPQVTSAAAEPEGNVNDQLEEQLDAVLDKVARSGQNSLTDNERRILMRASEVYRRRRS